jgi:Uma2 family endonuclease
MTVQLPISNEYQPVKLSAREFWLLADAGVFQEFVKTELIEGEIYVVNAVHSRHAKAHAALTVAIGIALKVKRSPLVLLSTPSTALSDDSIPEPDIAVASKAESKAIDGSDVLLAIEISDSTLAFDMGRKMRLYARHGIPEYWVVDVEGRVIHQFSGPKTEGYAERVEYAFGTEVLATTISGLKVATDGLL